MHTAKCCFLNLVILYFSFDLIKASTQLFVNQENGQKPAVLFTPCHEDSDCAGFGTNNFTCSNQYCLCDGSKFCDHPNKVGLNKLEESCSTNSDCMIEHSVCEEGKCQCEKDKAASLDKRSCLINTPKDTCTNCSETENTCSEGQCSCEKGFVPNSDSTQCLKTAVTIHDFCEEDVQCSETFVNAVCINTSCQCQASHKFNSTAQTCVKKAVLGGQCERDEDCEQSSDVAASNNISCVSGSCKCKSNFFEKEGQCTSLIEPCIEPSCNGFIVQMRLNQTCVPGRCECPEERQFCTNKDSTRVINPKKNQYNRGRPKKYPTWIHRWFYSLPALITEYWLIVIVLFIVALVHSGHQRRTLSKQLLLRFFLPLLAFHTTITTIYEVGYIEFIQLSLVLFCLTVILSVAISMYKIVEVANQPLRRRRPEPQMYDAIPRRTNLENEPRRRRRPSPIQSEEVIQNQPRGRGHGSGRGRGHGRGGRRNRHHR